MAKDIPLKRILLAAIIILGVVFRIWASQPTWIHWDENFYINIFQNFVDRGELTPYMWRLGNDTNIISGAGTGYGIFILIGWMTIFGESLFGVRMLMVLAGLVTTWVYYLISKQWWESREAGIAAMTFGIVSTSAFYTLVGRMDALAILSYSLLLFLHIVAVRQVKKWPHFWVGAVSILSTEIHILGLLYVGSLAIYYGFRYVEIVSRERKLMLDSYPVYFFCGAGIFGVLYVIIHILPDPQAYFLIPTTCSICESSFLQTEINRIQRFITFRPLDSFLVIVISAFAIKSRERYRHFSILFVGYIGVQIIAKPPSFV
ncbi:MAG: hypothetical protein GWN14_27310, partial [candidate division Zixibacteria bacterium]|nr:hypothetical protein [Gammaproteobacteria bacterium]NIX59532.1 hypothetical protein [candidate division Zixibacteria bacterium]